MRPLIIGTRKSALALAQTRLVAEAVREAFPEVEVQIREMTTIGDQRLDLSLVAAAGTLDKGLFTKELEEALLDGRIDAAVHSLKDLPTTLPAGLRLAAVLPRAAVDDWLVAKQPGGFAALPHGAVVATSSLRRHLQLCARRPDLEVVEIRGNVPTRLQKLRDEVRWNATVLAAAGLERLGLVREGKILVGGTSLYVANLSPAVMLPAVGQGAIGIETRQEISPHDAIFARINHAPTDEAVSLERSLLRALGGGCQMPLGVRSYRKNGLFHLDAVLFLDGREYTATGSDPARLAERLLAPEAVPRMT